METKNVGIYLFFGLVVLSWAMILRHDTCNKEKGEAVDCSKKNTKTNKQKLDRLYELARFQESRVKWRHHFITATVGAFSTMFILKAGGCKMNDIIVFLAAFLPFFIVGYFLDGFNQYHGAHRNHPSHAYHLRVSLQNVLAENKLLKNKILDF